MAADRMVHPSKNKQHATNLLEAVSTYMFCNNRGPQLEQVSSSSPHLTTTTEQHNCSDLDKMHSGTDGSENLRTINDEQIGKQCCSIDIENPNENVYQIRKDSSKEIVKAGRQNDNERGSRFNVNDLKLEDVDINHETDMRHYPRLQIKVDEFTDNPATRDANIIASPTIRPDHLALPYSPRFIEGNYKNENQYKTAFAQSSREHVRCFHHGVFRTIFSIAMAATALSLSVTCKHSTNFARLGNPMSIGVHYEDITRMGLFYMELCRGEESVNIDYANNMVTIQSFHYSDDNSIDQDPNETVVTQLTTSEYTSRSRLVNSTMSTHKRPKVCQKIRLKQDMVGDGIWNFTRIFAGVTEWIGGFVTFMLFTSFFWKTMNLIPICAGLFVTYFCQSLSFFFYESKLCKDFGCHQSEGSGLALSAIIFWFLAWVGVLNMILHASHKKRLEKIIEKKKAVAAAIYDTKVTKRAQSFMHNQISFLRLFSSSTRVNHSISETSDSSDATSESLDDDYVGERFEI